MARARKKSPTPKPDVAPDLEPPASPINSPDVFDEVIAARELPPAETTASQEPATAKYTTQIKRPDPFGEMTVALSNRNEGPKTRLYRNQRFQQMAVQFDEKPDEEIRQKLRAAGWTWRPAEGAWTMQLGERPGQTHREAQAFFTSLANEIRQANGLEPVTFPAQSR